VERALGSLRRRSRSRAVEVVSLPQPSSLRSRESNARFLVWVDAGLEALHEDWLECLLEELGLPKTAAVSPKIVSETGLTLWDGEVETGEGPSWNVARRIAAPNPACFAVERELIGKAKLPFEPAALGATLEALARDWAKNDAYVRYTPHTAFCLHTENGDGKRTRAKQAPEGERERTRR
jgi:hypothetical protein